MANLFNKKVFITGGTGSVGRVLVEYFSQNEYEVYFQFLKDIKTARLLSGKFGSKPIKINFTKKFLLPNIKFDIVINNAGLHTTSYLTHEILESDWTRTLRVNLEVPFMIIKKYLPNMIKNKWGRIINISSIYGLRATDQNLPYTVSKHGLSGVTKTIAKEYAAIGITCNEICPASIESNMMNGIAIEESIRINKTAEEYLNEIKNLIPAKRMALPQDIASTALFLASEEASFINGISIPVDGGLIC